MEKIVTKNTWLGLGVSIIVLISGVGLGAFFLCRGIMKQESESLYLILLCAISAFIGSFIGAKGKSGHLLHAIVVCTFLYLLIWLLTLSTEGNVSFDGYAMKETLAIWGSSILASFVLPRKSRSKTGKKGVRPSGKGKKRAVT